MKVEVSQRCRRRRTWSPHTCIAVFLVISCSLLPQSRGDRDGWGVRGKVRERLFDNCLSSAANHVLVDATRNGASTAFLLSFMLAFMCSCILPWLIVRLLVCEGLVSCLLNYMSGCLLSCCLFLCFVMLSCFYAWLLVCCFFSSFFFTCLPANVAFLLPFFFLSFLLYILLNCLLARSCQR